MAIPFITAQEAAEHIKNGDNVGFSGFTASGTPKVVTEALAERAIKEHEQGREFKINMFTGASTNDHVDGALARANAIGMRTPYQSNGDMRKRLNVHDAHYFDLHLSELAQKMRYGVFGDLDVAIIEAADIDDNGDIVLGTGVGISPTIAMMAKKVIVELNEALPKSIRGMHDLYIPNDPPCRREIPIYTASDRIGTPILKVDPAKIVGIVKSNAKDGVGGFAELDETTMLIGQNVCNFLLNELRAGRLPKTFLPMQSGVGNVANAVLHGLGEVNEIPQFEMYTEVIQDSVVDLMKKGKCRFASSCSMTFSDAMMDEVLANMDFFGDKIILRPGEISNHPEIVRRLGLITMNTALEADIFGNINSTHVLGTKMMNGIGGSGDFTRNGYLSIFSCPSITKGGLISNIVPMVSHLDHSEHSVDALITDQGIADLRGKDPVQRAETVIENCVHPEYKELLWDYLKLGKGGQTPHSLKAAFAFHNEFAESGDMRKVDWSKFA